MAIFSNSDSGGAERKVGPADFVEMPCIICGGGKARLMMKATADEDSFTPYTFSARRERKLCRYNIWKCGGCGLVRSSPVLREEAAGELYRQSLFIWENEADHASKTYADLLEKIFPDARSSGARVFEIGAGNGGFVRELLSRGFSDPIGVEPSSDCVLRADPVAVPQLVCDLFRPGLFPAESFDVATTFHVIDHLHDPLGTLRECARVLKPGGGVLIVCHDVEAFSARVLRGISPVFDIEHIYLFSRDTLGKLLEKAGFEPFESGSLMNTYPLEYWMRMLPVARSLKKLLPSGLKKMPVSLKAGNLYMAARKRSS